MVCFCVCTNIYMYDVCTYVNNICTYAHTHICTITCYLPHSAILIGHWCYFCRLISIILNCLFHLQTRVFLTCCFVWFYSSIFSPVVRADPPRAKPWLIKAALFRPLPLKRRTWASLWCWHCPCVFFTAVNSSQLPGGGSSWPFFNAHMADEELNWMQRMQEARAEPPAVMPPKISHQQHLQIQPPPKKKPRKNNLGGNEISIIDCKAVYPTHLKCRRRWWRPKSPHIGRGCMHARLERRRRGNKKKRAWGGAERRERGSEETNKPTKRKRKKKRPIRKRKSERGIVIVSPTRLFCFFVFCFFFRACKGVASWKQRQR